MRFVVFGAGAIGGSVGTLLSRAGHDVAFIARGPHREAIREHGLRCETPDGVFVVRAPVVSSPSDGDIVLLAVKTQDVEGAVRSIAPDIPVVCMTNGIAAERIAANHVREVYGAHVFVPATHLEPGIVQLWASPMPGAIDIGCYPQGVTPLANKICSALRSAGFASEVRDDIMRYKRGKLLGNLGNVLEVLQGPNVADEEIHARAREEALACFEAAGLSYTIEEPQVSLKPIEGATRTGCSTWQSFARGKQLEVDFFNGEIVALGRAHGVPTPINAALQRLVAAKLRRE